MSSSKYGKDVIVIHDDRDSSYYSSSSSSSRASSSSRHMFTPRTSMDPSKYTHGDRTYRDSNSDHYLVSEKTSSSRKGTLVSVINHYAPNPATDEPKLSDYYSQNQTSQSRRKRSA